MHTPAFPTKRRLAGKSRRAQDTRGHNRLHHWSILVAWGIAVISLALLGQGIEARLSPMSLTVPGSPSSRAEAMLQARFGTTIPVAILLRGPSSELAVDGPRVVEALQRLRDVQVLSPFETTSAMAPATVSALRPRSDAALVLVNFDRPESAAMATVPETERILARNINPPVHSYLSGVAVVGHALQVATLADTERAEMLALPALILVLLLVFRSPVAAALPLLMGAATVAAGRGLLWLASHLTPINSLGVAIAAMMSLALGVDYALLMVSRVRQELAAGHPHEVAVPVAGKAAGRTIAAAGGTLALTMLAASAVATPGLLGPVAIGVVISGLVSVALAVGAMPALLYVLGDRLNRWQLHLPGRRLARGVAATRLARGLIARPALAVPLILFAMMVLALPASALRLGPPDATELPAASPARAAVRMLESTIGPGWSAPFVIVASARQGAMTTTRRIEALARWQQQVSRETDVAAVLGPASAAGAQHKLAEANAVLADAPRRLRGARHGASTLRAGLHSAGSGVQAMRAGFAAAARGARSLGNGAAEAKSGAGKAASQTARAQGGAELLADRTGAAHRGAQQLATESGRAQAGATRLASEGGRAQAGAKQVQEGLTAAAAGSDRLARGLDEAAAGAERLAASDHELAGGAAEVAQGMDALDATVHAVLAPLDLLSAQLRAWTALIARLRSSEQVVAGRMAQAMGALESMRTGRADPRYSAAVQALSEAARAFEHSDIATLGGVGQELGRDLEELASLPGKLTELIAVLDRLTAGADRVAAGTRESETGALALGSALRGLASGGHSLDAGLARLSGGTGGLAMGLGKLTAGDRRLAGGLGALSAGDRRLAGGLGKLTAGDKQLAGGLGDLTAGDRRLTDGVGALGRGAARLRSGLTRAGERSGGLLHGLDGAQRGLRRYASMLEGYERDYRLLHTQAPDTLGSGYMVLTALDGTVPPVREQVAQLINVDGGGQAARMMVIADSPPNSAATVALSARLRRSLPALAAATGSNVEIGQGAQYLLDYKNANTDRFPWLLLALVAVATLTLIVVLRALLLPLIAVMLNMATIAVALGALEWLTRQHVLGGPGYIDAASGAGIVSIMFVLSIDYEVFLLARMRESWVAEHDHRKAIAHGLHHTASVITGSAVIMTAVFAAFAQASVVPLCQFGVGLTIAVLLDATIVRLVLLPATMRIVGERVWWLPSWLERHLPAFEGRPLLKTEGVRSPQAAAPSLVGT